ncbi:hypothetical protein CNR22_13455 [Sphingobacteriaceae bacterium]|nr:hypothetical protein CNR22_13455 [Sphingobacteriaceae bacterium]
METNHDHSKNKLDAHQVAPKTFVLKAYTKKELRLLYDIPETTFRRWLKQIPETANTGYKNWLDVNQVEAVLKHRGVPGVRIFK